MIRILFKFFNFIFFIICFDNVSCNIITVINLLLIVLIASDLYNILFGTSLDTRSDWAWLYLVVKNSRVSFWPIHRAYLCKFLEKLRIVFYMWTDVKRMVLRLISIQKCESRQNTKSVIGIWSDPVKYGRIYIM